MSLSDTVLIPFIHGRFNCSEMWMTTQKWQTVSPVNEWDHFPCFSYESLFEMLYLWDEISGTYRVLDNLDLRGAAQAIDMES